MCESADDGLRWDSVTYGKHTTVNTRAWDRSFARRFSERPGSHAQYNPWISRNEIERVEMECARGEIGEQIETQKHAIVFCYEHTSDIGVSKGEFTRHILVYRESNGSVHGYPITGSELNKKKQRARKRRGDRHEPD